MRINDKFPPPHEMLLNEIKTLAFLKDTNSIQTRFVKLAADAYSYYFAVADRSKQPPAFAFESQFAIQTQKGEAVAHIGAQIVTDEADETKYSLVTYYLAVGKTKRGKMQLIRKYHFDYALPDTTHRQPHPVFHLQYAGRAAPALKELNDEHLFVWLDEPRIYFMPMSLALLINLILKEFPDENNTKIRESGEWRGLIRRNEDLLIKPYCDVCHAFIKGRKGSELFINDFCYGK
jgi:hypothetical protein